MQTPKRTGFFLGANAPMGFYSLYGELIDPHTDNKLYIIKGGAGCGKSSFMKAIGKGMTDASLDVEYIHCSADPDSLDAIYIPHLKTAYVDGTAPHVIEPRYPGVVEEYLNLGEFYDTEALKTKKAEVIPRADSYQSLYWRAYQCICAAGGVLEDRNAHLIDDMLIAAVKKRTRGIISREIGKKKNLAGTIRRRFLGALTPQGQVTFFDTANMQADRVYHLDNTLGLAHYMLDDIVSAASKAGHDVILCPAPMNPDHWEHLLIPALRLAFLSSNNQVRYTGSVYRHIRLDAMTDKERLKAHKTRLRFSKKVSALLLDEAVSTLASAKQIHDELEQIYNPHVDFDGVYDLAEDHLRRLLMEI